MLTITGSYGEGGGQILRTALSLSAILTIPVKITDIRANRPKPGLRPQHLTGVLAMADTCSAEVAGAEIGSRELLFKPRGVKPGEYFFDVSKTTGSAGSVMLILQTLLPALMKSKGESRVTLVGGTHVPWSPPYQYIAESFLPALSRMGARACAEIVKWGFYPKGGGRVVARVSPAKGFASLDLTSRGRVVRISGLSAVANLPEGIARRQAAAARERLAARGLGANIEIIDAPSPGQGTFICLTAEFEGVTLAFTALGERAKRAETVGEEAADSLLSFISTDACVEEHLADQVLLYMALADGTSKMRVSRISRHLLTNAYVIKQFLPDVKVDMVGSEGGPGEVVVG